MLFVMFSLFINDDFLSTNQEIGWEASPRNELFSVEWVLNLDSNNQLMSSFCQHCYVRFCYIVKVRAEPAAFRKQS